MIAAPSRRASCERLSETGLVCPVCRSRLNRTNDHCVSCDRAFPNISGIPDLRLTPDRYLSLNDERAKAELLASIAPTTDFAGLCRAYYTMTSDVDSSRSKRYLSHLERAERRAEAFVGLLPTNGRALEVGCGTGGMLAAASRRGIAIEGVDIALRWLVLAAKRQKAVNVPIVAANAERLPWPDSTFAAVFADSVLEHLDDPANALWEWRRVAKPGATLIVVSPNRYSLAPDPHVGLWGLGFLPRAWQKGYVRRRRRCGWPVRPLSANEALRMANEAGWTNAYVEAAPAPDLGCVAAHLTYEVARRLPLADRFLRQFGPLWLLTATREDLP